MNSQNPYQTPTDAGLSRSRNAVGGEVLLRRTSQAVLVVGIVVLLRALRYGIGVCAGLIWISTYSSGDIAENPLLPPELAEIETNIYWTTLQNTLFSLAGAAICGVFAWLLLRYSRRLGTSASSDVDQAALIRAQSACWLMAASLAVAYVASGVLWFFSPWQLW